MTIEVKFQENVPFIFVFLVDVIAAGGYISRDNEKNPENLLCYFFELLRIRMTELLWFAWLSVSSDSFS